MNAVLLDNREKVSEICRRYRVRRLEAFGSGAGADFDPDKSDLDFLVEYLPLESGQHADMYFGLLEELEDLFDRSVDLVMTASIQNPYFLESVETTRTPLYAA